MKALVISEPGRISLMDYPQRTAGEEAQFRPLLVGLCGTDLELIDGSIDPSYVRYPLIIGHEWCGVAEGAPDQGDLYVAQGIVPCFACRPCRSGQTNLCETYEEVGFTRDGACAELVSVPSRLVHNLGKGPSPEDAVLIEPAAVVETALRRTEVSPATRTLVIGDGTVGLLAVCLLKLRSAQVHLLGAKPGQAVLAKQAGADLFTTDPSELKGPYELVVEAAGSSAAVEVALSLLARGGTALLIGLPPQGDELPVAPDHLVNNHLSILASFGYTASAFEATANTVARGMLRPGFLVTHRLPIERYADAIELLRSNHSPRGKIVLEINPPQSGTHSL